MGRRLLPCVCASFVACRPDPLPAACLRPHPEPVGPRPGNIVWIVMDDVGVDKLGVYGVHPRPAPTPQLDALAARGLRFTSAYGEPVCSPARAALLTGRRPLHNWIGNNIDGREEIGLPSGELLVPEALRAAPGGPWSSTAIGKWHLTALGPDAFEGPRRQGFDHFDGLLANANRSEYGDEHGDHDYWNWEHVVDGAVSISQEYLLTNQADAAIDALKTMPEPFFLYVAFSAAHIPLHVPPEDLWSQSDPTDGDAGIGDAMIEALDHEIGRLVAAVGDRATVFVTSDNGTSSHLIRPPADPERAKVSVYTGGTHVPLIVVGPDVVPGVSDALVHATDLFPTALDLAGVDPARLGVRLDGRSLVPILDGDLEGGARRCVVAERFRPNGPPSEHEDVAILDASFSLIRRRDFRDELYRRDPLAPVEGDDLLRAPLGPAAAAAVSRLRAWLDEDFPPEP